MIFTYNSMYYGDIFDRRAWGDRWLREGDSALLRVRSVLVPETYNVLIDPRLADAALIKRLAVMPYPLDSRIVARD
jgi:hypothetical protein